MKRTLSILLCLAMMAGLLVLPGCSDESHDHSDAESASIADGSVSTVDIPNEDAPLSGYPHTPNDGHAHVWGSETYANEEGKSCVFGPGWVAYHVCTLCGAEEHIAFRPTGKWPNGDHNWGTEEKIPTECPENPTTQKTCKDCGHTESTKGGHIWGEWTTTSGGNTCTAVQTRTCSACGKTESKGPVGHSWRVLSSTEAKCGQAGITVRKCNVCGTEETVTNSPALTHNFGNAYESNEKGHFQRCKNCGLVTDVVAHTAGSDGKCTTCGYQVSTPTKPTPTKPEPTKPDPATCSHTYGAWEAKSVGSIKQHVKVCTKCGNTISENCWDRATTRTSCTQNIQCSVCGTLLEVGSKSHILGSAVAAGDKHVKKCERTGCQYTVEESHTYTVSGGVYKCSACGYVNESMNTAHTVVYGSWISSGSVHTRTCTVSGCTDSSHKESAAHTGGTPDCAGNAVCSVCHATYNTGTKGTTHVGGTNVTNEKAATETSVGYTGDTVCATCGAVISKGQEIPKLAKNHTHDYSGGWKTDATSHWQECECGERVANVAHFFKDGKCTVCGFADPNYVPPQEHKHVWSSAWSTSSTEHWHACEGEGCTETTDRAAHAVVEENGVTKCLTCGITLGQIDQKVEEEAKQEEEKKQEEQKPIVTEFPDVKPDDYFYDSSTWAQNLGIVKGYADGSFKPETDCTESQILVMLYRAAGKPPVDLSSSDKFAGETDEFREALIWALQYGMISEDWVNGACTRGSAAVFLWKYAGRVNAASAAQFADVEQGTEDAAAVAWAYEKGIVNGTSATTFTPDKTCTRGDIVTMLYRDQVKPIQR